MLNPLKSLVACFAILPFSFRITNSEVMKARAFEDTVFRYQVQFANKAVFVSKIARDSAAFKCPESESKFGFWSLSLGSAGHWLPIGTGYAMCLRLAEPKDSVVQDSLRRKVLCKDQKYGSPCLEAPFATVAGDYSTLNPLPGYVPSKANGNIGLGGYFNINVSDSAALALTIDTLFDEQLLSPKERKKLDRSVPHELTYLVRMSSGSLHCKDGFGCGSGNYDTVFAQFPSFRLFRLGGDALFIMEGKETEGDGVKLCAFIIDAGGNMFKYIHHNLYIGGEPVEEARYFIKDGVLKCERLVIDESTHRPQTIRSKWNNGWGPDN